MAEMQKIGGNVIEVVLSFCDAPESRQLLSCFPNVVKLSLGHFYGIAETISPTLFPKLKHLQLEYPCNVSCLHLLLVISIS